MYCTSLPFWLEVGCIAETCLLMQEAVPVVLMFLDRLAIDQEVRIYCTFASYGPSSLKVVVEGGQHS